MAISGSFRTSAYDARCLEFSWTRASYSIENNTTTINYTLKYVGTGEHTKYYAGNIDLKINGVSIYSTGRDDRIVTTDGLVVKTGTYTFTHNADGTKSFTAYAEAGIWYYDVNCTGSATFTLDAIPRQALITSYPSSFYDDNVSVGIRYTNPAGNAVSSLQVCMTLEGNNDDIKYRDVPKSGGYYEFVLTDAEREVLRKATLNGSNERKISFYLRTIIGGTTLYDKKQSKLIILNAEPVVSITAEDRDIEADLLKDDISVIIKGFNNVYVNVSATPIKGATIKSYSIKNGSKTINSSNGYFTNTVNNEFTISVTDNRGLVTTKVITMPMIEYVPLSIGMKANMRITEDLAQANIDVWGACFSGNFGAYNNNIEVFYRYKVNGGSYSTWQRTYSGAGENNRYDISFSLSNLDYTNTYTFQALVSDMANRDGVLSTEITVSAMPIFDWGETDFNFNVPIKFNGTQLEDFVTETGIDGQWRYRLWNSGYAELWTMVQVTVNVTNQWGSLYTSGQIAATNLQYPFTFTELPIVNAALMPFGTGGIIMASGNVYGSQTQTGAIEIARGTAVNNGQFLISYQVRGKWK